YAETAGKRRKEHDTAHGTQPGDPAKAAQAIITVVTSPDAPELLLLGTDALAAIGGVLDGQRAEIDAWRGLSASTDLDA
ncbi:MAG: family NAD(P)-dependent oxidoreductase, partial [Leifsonia sp.]|nr:family NAD(P)-dependent oxidoreductase [Leifsonia sp.]